MSTPHPAKRRRLDLGNVNKPFRSPLRTGPPSSIKPTPAQTPAAKQPVLPSPSPTQAAPAPPPPARTTSPAHKPSPPPSPEVPDSQHDPASSPIRRSPTRNVPGGETELESQLALLRTHPSLLPASRLPALTHKWRDAARQALETLLAAEAQLERDRDADKAREDRLEVLEDMLLTGRDEMGDRLGVGRGEMEREARRLRSAEEGGMAGLLFRLGIGEGVVGWEGEGWRED